MVRYIAGNLCSLRKQFLCNCRACLEYHGFDVDYLICIRSSGVHGRRHYLGGIQTMPAQWEREGGGNDIQCLIYDVLDGGICNELIIQMANGLPSSFLRIITTYYLCWESRETTRTTDTLVCSVTLTHSGVMAVRLYLMASALPIADEVNIVNEMNMIKQSYNCVVRIRDTLPHLHHQLQTVGCTAKW